MLTSDQNVKKKKKKIQSPKGITKDGCHKR